MSAELHSEPGWRERALPFLGWLKGYRAGDLRHDAIAGLTVSVVLIPQAMAYALLAGLPPVHGLYAAAVTPVLGGMWGSLRQLATGPIAIMSLLVLTTLSPMAEPGTAEYVDLAILVALMVGTLYLVVGVLRLGQVMAFISHSAVEGFTAAASLIIISTQLPHLLGLEVERHELIFPMLVEIAAGIPDLDPRTALLGGACFLFIVAVRRFNRSFPGGLIALVAATYYVYRTDPNGEMLAIVGESPSGLPTVVLRLPELEVVSSLLGPVAVIALVSFAETYSIGKAISSKTKQKIDVDQEFLGQGIANVAAGLVQGFPVSGSISRTAINYTAGARTALSSVFTSAIVVVALLFLTPLLTYIPKTALAALVISAVMSLFHPRKVLSLWKKNRDDGIVALIVFSLSLLLKPDYALLIGVLASLILFLWKTMRPRIVRMTKDPDLNMFVNADATERPGCPQILHVKLGNVVYFANAEYAARELRRRLAETPTPIRFLLIDFSAISFIDITAIEELRSLLHDVEKSGTRLAFFGVNRPVLATFRSSGFLAELEEAGVTGVLDLDSRQVEAISTLFGELDHGYCRETCPYSLFYECDSVKGEKDGGERDEGPS